MIEAYREAGHEAVANGEIIECYRSKSFTVKYPYSKMGDVMNVLKRANITPENTDFQIECKLDITLRLTELDSITSQLEDINQVELKLISED